MCKKIFVCASVLSKFLGFSLLLFFFLSLLIFVRDLNRKNMSFIDTFAHVHDLKVFLTGRLPPSQQCTSLLNNKGDIYM